METKKWSTKKKVLVSILVILCAAIIAGRAVYVLQTRSAAAGLDRKGDKGFDNPDT